LITTMRIDRYFILLMLFATALRAADFAWKLERFEGRDYVTLQQIVEFYGFTTPLAPVDNVVNLESDKEQLQITLNSREVEINGVKHWLAFPVLAMDGKILLSRLDLGKTIEPSLRPEFIQGMQPVKTVVLDPGHGAVDKGAVSRFGFEKDFALDVCMRVRRLLQDRGYRVEMTRSTDVLIPLEERPMVANVTPDSIFVSVHFNSSSQNGQASGFEVFSVTPRGAPSTAAEALSLGDLRNEPGNATDVQSGALATCVYYSLLGNIPQADRGLKNARFAVLRLATVPAILIEGGFLSNNTDSSLVASAAWRTKLAEAIADGIDNYKNLAEHKQRPKTIADYRRIAPDHVTLRDMTDASSAVTAKKPPQ
jgi:N-acetylmuramoyl-L-alanine amidase